MSKKVELTILGAAMILAGDALIFYLLPPEAVVYVIGVHALLSIVLGGCLIVHIWDRGCTCCSPDRPCLHCPVHGP